MNPHDNKHIAIIAVVLIVISMAVAWEHINRHIGRAFILRAPTGAVDAASLHKDAEPVRIYGATDDGLPHVTHELAGAR